MIDYTKFQLNPIPVTHNLNLTSSEPKDRMNNLLAIIGVTIIIAISYKVYKNYVTEKDQLED